MITRGIRNNNPLNIRKGGKWLGLRSEQTDPAFCQFVCVEYGFRAALICLRTYHYKYKCNTIRQIIERWAPVQDGNNVESYIYHVCLNMRLFLRSSDLKVFESEVNENFVVNKWINQRCPHPILWYLIRSMAVVESCSSFADVDFHKVVSLL